MATPIRAEMAATVWQVCVAEGDVVATADTIMILESMKMEVPIAAPSGGTVTRVHVTEGQVVGDGTLLVEIG